MSVKIRGGDRLSAQAESLISGEVTWSCRCALVAPGFPRKPPRDIVPWCLYVLKSQGYSHADIDSEEFGLLHPACVASGQFYDGTTTH